MVPLEVEQSQVFKQTCPHCGGPRTVVTGFVHYAGGDTLASYIASLYPLGPDHGQDAFIDVTLGTWGRNDISDHITFEAWCKPTEQSCMLHDPLELPGDHDSAILGNPISREEGLTHPRVDEFWHVVDAVLEQDPVVSRFYYGDA